MEIFKHTLTIPPAENKEDRLTQLQDEVDRVLSMSHYDDWANGREIDLDEWKITYPDGGSMSIMATEFICLVGNREIQVDTLEEAEQWLWENHSSSNYLDEVDNPTPDKITCGACTAAIGEHTFDKNCKFIQDSDGSIHPKLIS